MRRPVQTQSHPDHEIAGGFSLTRQNVLADTARKFAAIVKDPVAHCRRFGATLTPA
jgi:hypothetical protein